MHHQRIFWHERVHCRFCMLYSGFFHALFMVLRERGSELGSQPSAAAIGTISQRASRSDVLFRSKALVTCGVNSCDVATFLFGYACCDGNFIGSLNSASVSEEFSSLSESSVMYTSEAADVEATVALCRRAASSFYFLRSRSCFLVSSLSSEAKYILRSFRWSSRKSISSFILIMVNASACAMSKSVSNIFENSKSRCR